MSMSSLARRSAVAKATVYNHFRDRDDVLQALLEAERDHLVAHCAAVPTDERLLVAAHWLSSSSVIEGLRRYDPAALVTVADRAFADPGVRDVVAGWCPSRTDSLDALRWLVSFAVVAGGPGEAALGPETPS